MSRIFLYRRDHPLGVIFDTEGGRPDPKIPDGWKSLGWTENRGEVQLTRDELIEAVVREELAKQPKDRDRLEAEYRDKTGDIPHFASKDKTLVSVLDDSHARERKRK
jgi:hypothetical protein